MANTQSEENYTGVVLNRQKLDLTPGAFVSLNNQVFRVSQCLDFDFIVGVNVESGRSQSLRIKELKPVPDSARNIGDMAFSDIVDIDDKDWRTAEKRYSIIKPLLNSCGVGRKLVEARAEEKDVNPATVYRWIKRYQSLGVISALIPKKRGCQPGALRMSNHTEDIIREVIKDTYLSVQRSTPQKVILEVQRRCHDRGVKPPHFNTVRNRLRSLPEKEILRKRGQKDEARNKYLPAAGRFPHADYPLAVVQIDHTPVDIILVDDEHRMPIGRPWVTLAMDIYSRMITGYYLSFDPPSGTSIAMCVAHSILAKDQWLSFHNIDASWDVWGVMGTIHVDNGADFRSDSFRQSCLMHCINLEFRPVTQPQYGGHIERVLGTFLKDIHDLPGTTFSSIKERDSYNSEKHAAMTISEFERWLITLICKVYHQRMHSGIGMTPAKKWEIGMFGNAEIAGSGLPASVVDPQALMLDFMPSFKRSIQKYGVSIDGLTYYADVLRTWINASSPDSKSEKRKFIFRRDPRDISSIWFYDPDTKQYFQIPYADQTLQSMSIWEYKQASEAARKDGMKSVNTSQIMQALTEMREIVKDSTTKTKKARRQSQRKREHEKKITPVNLKKKKVKQTKKINLALDDDIEAFDDIS